MVFECHLSLFWVLSTECKLRLLLKMHKIRECHLSLSECKLIVGGGLRLRSECKLIVEAFLAEFIVAFSHV